MDTLNRLMTIATVSKKIREQLLTNPVQALETDYQGKKINLTRKDKKI